MVEDSNPAIVHQRQQTFENRCLVILPTLSSYGAEMGGL